MRGRHWLRAVRGPRRWDAMILGQCPVCRRIFKVDDRYAGMVGRCKACGSTLYVPGQPDEGLDGLPPLATPPQPYAAPQGQPGSQPIQAIPAPPVAWPAAAQWPQAATPPAQPTAPQEPPPAPATQAIQGGTHPADELSRPHDVRRRYAPAHGPTAMPGPWLKEDRERLAGAQEPPPHEAGPEAEHDDGPEPEGFGAPEPLPGGLLADRYFTPSEPERVSSERRPLLVKLLCVAFVAVGIAFLLQFFTAGTWGKVAGGLGLLLACLATVRLWMASWDGLLAGGLFALCVAGGALIPCEISRLATMLLAASGLVLLLVVVIVVRSSGREYFSS